MKEKKLAAQIIVKFFKHFPTLQNQALNAIIDLCEDDGDNNSVRIICLVCMNRNIKTNIVIFHR